MVSGIKIDVKIDSKNLLQTGQATLGNPLRTPWEHSSHPGLEIDASGVRFYSIFDLRRSKSDSKSTLRAPLKLILTYIIEFDKLNRSRQVPKLENRLEYPKK